MTNENWMRRVMHDGGPLVQAFVIDAVAKHAERVAAIPDAELQDLTKDWPVHGYSWREAARFLKKAIDERMK